MQEVIRLCMYIYIACVYVRVNDNILIIVANNIIII